jgi:ShK domain-like
VCVCVCVCVCDYARPQYAGERSPFFVVVHWRTPRFFPDTHEIVLTSGDLVFYESSKVFHGRPRPFIGSWYTSVFVHYYPKYYWAGSEFLNKEKIYAIPPHWRQPPGPMKYEIPIVMVGTSMKEPTCPHQWCSTQHSYKWSGPGEEGYWITPTRERIPFHPQKDDCEDRDPACEQWARLETKECETNPGYMLFHCKKSCGACRSSSGSKEEL